MVEDASRQHLWMLDVLAAMVAYAQHNGFDTTAARLIAAQAAAMAEVPGLKSPGQAQDAG